MRNESIGNDLKAATLALIALVLAGHFTPMIAAALGAITLTGSAMGAVATVAVAGATLFGGAAYAVSSGHIPSWAYYAIVIGLYGGLAIATAGAGIV